MDSKLPFDDVSIFGIEDADVDCDLDESFSRAPTPTGVDERRLQAPWTNSKPGQLCSLPSHLLQQVQNDRDSQLCFNPLQQTRVRHPPGPMIPFDSLPFTQLVSPASNRYSCPVCLMEFADKRNFRHHYMVHSGEKPYACPHCPYRARQTGTLNKHVKLRHPDSTLLTTKIIKWRAGQIPTTKSCLNVVVLK